jgi:hypothetical protein
MLWNRDKHLDVSHLWLGGLLQSKEAAQSSRLLF